MEGKDSAVDWFKIAKEGYPFTLFLKIYAAKRGISPIRSISLNHNGNQLFLNDMEKQPSEMGMNDQDLISISIRPPSSSQERAHLKQLHEAKGNRKPKKNLPRERQKATGRN